jgi:hypothetical protein
MQQQQGWCIFCSRFAVEDVETIDIGGTKLDFGHSAFPLL